MENSINSLFKENKLSKNIIRSRKKGANSKLNLKKTPKKFSIIFDLQL